MPDTILDQTYADLNSQSVAIVDGTPSPGDLAAFASATHVAATTPSAIAADLGIGSRLLASQTISVAQAAVTFTTRNAPGQTGAIFQSDFNIYEFSFDEVLPASNGPNFIMEFSTDGGATWLTAAGSYFYSLFWFQNTPSSGVQNDGSHSSTYALLVNLVQYAAAGYGNEGVCGTVTIYRPLAAKKHKYTADVIACQSGGSNRQVRELQNGWATGTTPITAVRFRFTTGNVASGIVMCTGKTI